MGILAEFPKGFLRSARFDSSRNVPLLVEVREGLSF
jgi:hypothetical protein